MNSCNNSLKCYPIQKIFPNMIDNSKMFVYTKVNLPNIATDITPSWT